MLELTMLLSVVVCGVQLLNKDIFQPTLPLLQYSLLSQFSQVTLFLAGLSAFILSI